jgi:hypothetical protein
MMSRGKIEKARCHSANVAAVQASSFGIPVWITEFNSNIAAKHKDGEAAAARGTWRARKAILALRMTQETRSRYIKL